jgi:eukaryotic-like serine/threonine-protein kinase
MTAALSQNLKLIGRYSILRELRRDRYTVAYLAMDPVLNRELIVKAVELKRAGGHEGGTHDKIDQAFMRQAQAAGRLHHPHIVTVFDAGRLHNVGYLALEKVDGKLLDEALAEGFRPGFLQAADITARVADAIEYAHARGVPHGHLGPSLIYLQGTEKTPKVMGFGGWIDNGATGDFELTGTHSMLPYFQGELSPDARRKDLRALGALLFLLVTGSRPDVNVLRARRGSESAIIDLRPAAPLALAEIAESALELRNLRQYATAGQMRNALTTFLWGNRGAQGLPNAATITGSPARIEILPQNAPAGVAALPASPPLPPPVPPRTRVLGSSAMGLSAFAVAAVGVMAIAAAALLGRPEPTRTQVDVAPESAAAPVMQASAATASPAGASSEPPRTAAQTTRFGPPPGKAARADTIAPSQGVIELAVAPWGDIYVNGKARGTTPPLQRLMLPAGRHVIEIRNGERQPFVTQIDVTPGQPQQLSYRFQ